MTTPANALDRLSTEGGRACPVCGKTVSARIDLFDYQLFECAHCNCWSSDALARDARTSFVPENYFSHADSDRDKWEKLSRQLAWPVDRPLLALDVGCGTGAYLEYLREQLGRNALLEGIELDPERAAQSRGRDLDLRIHEGDALATLARLDRPFDQITLWDVFEHVTAPLDLLEGLAQVLAPGGVIYLQTINERSILPTLGRAAYRLSGRRIRYPARRTHEAHHLVFFVREGIEYMAREAGLQVREVWFDRLARSRMEGGELVRTAASLLLAFENALGNGLFINVILEKRKT
jgi:2-polyprenyl-3-methyl-5-hydroxy-6-metoxy-1,4-benzoquinol methylase